MQQANLNRVYLIGRLTHGATLAYSQQNQARLTFSVATETRWKNKQTGEWTGETEFTNCVLFGPAGERLADEMHTGTTVHVDGRLRTREYENKQGQKVKATDVVVDKVQVLALPRRAAQDQEAAPRAAFVPPTSDVHGAPDDDLPF